MAKIKRPDANNLVFSSKNANGERTLFNNQNQTSDLIDDNMTDDFRRGFGIYGPDDKPKITDFNALGFTSSSLYAYIFQSGIPEWGQSQEYHVNSVVTAGGDIYFSNTNFNVGSNPVPSIQQVAWNVEDVSDTTSNFFTRNSDICTLSDNFFAVASDQSQRLYLLDRTGNEISIIGSTDIGSVSGPSEFLDIEPNTQSVTVGGSTITSRLSNDGSYALVMYDGINVSKNIDGFNVGVLHQKNTSAFGDGIVPVNDRDFIFITVAGERYFFEGDANGGDGQLTLLDTFPNSLNFTYTMQTTIATDGAGTVAHLFANDTSGSLVIYFNTTPFDFSSFSTVTINGPTAGTTKQIAYSYGLWYVSIEGSNADHVYMAGVLSDPNPFFPFALPFAFTSNANDYPIIGSNKNGNLYVSKFISSLTSGFQNIYKYDFLTSSTPEIVGAIDVDNSQIVELDGVDDAIVSHSANFSGLTKIILSDNSVVIPLNESNNVITTASGYVFWEASSKISCGDFASGIGAKFITSDAIVSQGTITGPLRVCRIDNDKIALMKSDSIAVYDINIITGDFTKIGTEASISASFSFDLTSFADNNAPAGTYKIAAYIEGNGDLIEYSFDGNTFVDNGALTTGLGLSGNTTLSSIDRDSETVLVYDDGAVDLIRLDYNGTSFDTAFIEDATTVPFSIEGLGDGFGGRVVAASYEAFNRGFLLEVLDTQTNTVSLPITLGTKEFTNGILINDEYVVAASADDGSLNLFVAEFDLVFNEDWRRLNSSDTSFSAFGTAMVSENINDAVKELLYLKYPVGSFYESEIDNDPAVILGFGNWQRISGKILLAVDPAVPEYDTGGKTGGAFNYSVSDTILTLDQIPNHKHDMKLQWQGNNKASEGAAYATNREINQGDFAGTDTRTTESAGGSVGHGHEVKTKPPFDTAYVWLRLED